MLSRPEHWGVPGGKGKTCEDVSTRRRAGITRFIAHNDATLFSSRLWNIRVQMAAAADKVADEADTFAAILESAAIRGDSVRRLAMAEREREIAAVERRNATQLRDRLVGSPKLEPLPQLHEG